MRSAYFAWALVFDVGSAYFPSAHYSHAANIAKGPAMPPNGKALDRRDALGSVFTALTAGAISVAGVAGMPQVAFASKDCFSDCKSNCVRNAPKSEDYCKQRCAES